MTKRVNTKKPVLFYDDRCKADSIFFMKKILYQDKKVCLCQAVDDDGDKELVLFNKSDGSVLYISLTENLMFWYAKNYEKK